MSVLAAFVSQSSPPSFDVASGIPIVNDGEICRRARDNEGIPADGGGLGIIVGHEWQPKSINQNFCVDVTLMKDVPIVN